jgi:hypothetical protein
MKQSEIQVGHYYLAKASDRVVPCRVDAVRERPGYRSPTTSHRVNAGTSYDVTDMTTGRKTTFRSAAKFRRECNANGGPLLQTAAQLPDRYQGLKDGTVKPDGLTEECIAAGTEWY